MNNVALEESTAHHSVSILTRHPSFNISIRKLPSFEFPQWLLAVTLICCLFPLLHMWGVHPWAFNLASVPSSFDVTQLTQQQLSTPHLMDQMHYVLRGGIHHALLEWTAVVIAFVFVVIAFFHYSTNRDITAPLLGLALVMSGMMDALHTLTATRVINATAENQDLISFTWTLSRSFNAIVLLIGGVLIALSKRRHLTIEIRGILFIAVILSAAVYILANWITSSEQLPQTQFPGGLITRPYDVFPLVVFSACLPLYWLIFRQHKNYLTVTVLFSLLANTFSEAYMSFNSERLFDHAFNAAHGLKILSYALPCLGFLLDYRAIFLQRQKEQEIMAELNQSLLESEQRMKTINDLLPVGLLLVNADGCIVRANQYAHKLFGYLNDQLPGLNVDTLVPIETRLHHKALREKYQQKPRNRQMASEVDFLMGVCRDGTHVPLEIGLGPIVLEGKHHTLVSLLDISERKNFVDDLKQKNEKMDKAIFNLTQSNEQLERFAFVCSHDLQEPVRMVQSFGELLEKRLTGKLDEKDKEYLHYMTDGAQRAREMISDILQFCRLEQSVDRRELVNLSEVCEKLNKTLEKKLEEKNALFLWDDPLPTFTAVPSQIFQLLLNLVSNGIKFNNNQTPTVSLRTEKEGDYWRIQIQDNGIGINPKYQQQIFDIFERLHAKNEFPGTGIGLAICKKIAKQHNAEISVQSEEECGSTFILRWPAEEISTLHSEPFYEKEE